MLLRLSFVTHHGWVASDPKKQCSFCLEEVGALGRMVVGPSVSICDGCTARCVDALQACRAKG